MHKTVPAQIRTVARGRPGVGVARVFRAQSASQVSEPSSEKSCKNIETHMESKTRFQRQGPADFQANFSLSDMMRNTYYVVYNVVYDIIYDITYDIVCDIVYES